MTIRLTSEAFQPGQPIPKVCTGEGQDRSPQLAWDPAPPEVREWALICDDPDAPTPTPWVMLKGHVLATGELVGTYERRK